MKFNRTHCFRLGGVFLLVALVAPFFGLMASAIGMVHVFGELREVPGALPAEQLSGALSSKLTTTYIGLGVALVCVVFGLILVTLGWIGYFDEQTGAGKDV
jgi:biopolymer transport protein ExbB/TolQ